MHAFCVGLLHKKQSAAQQRGGCAPTAEVVQSSQQSPPGSAPAPALPTCQHTSVRRVTICALRTKATPRGHAKLGGAELTRASGPRVQREHGDARTQADIHTRRRSTPSCGHPRMHLAARLHATPWAWQRSRGATLPVQRGESCPTFSRSVGPWSENACMAPEGCVEQAWVRGPSSADCLKAIRTETGCRGPHCRRARS